MVIKKYFRIIIKVFSFYNTPILNFYVHKQPLPGV